MDINHLDPGHTKLDGASHKNNTYPNHLGLTSMLLNGDHFVISRVRSPPIIHTKRFTAEGERGEENENGDVDAGGGDSHYDVDNANDSKLPPLP